MFFFIALLKFLFICFMTILGFTLSDFYSTSAFGNAYNGPLTGFTIAVIIVFLETKFKPIFKKTTFSIILGLIIGLTTSYLLVMLINTFINSPKWIEVLRVFITLTITYLSIVTVIQTQDKFKFIIPYFEFRGELIAKNITLIDFSALIDSRLINILKSGIIDGQLILPKSAKEELKKMASSTEHQKKIKGELGLSNYNAILNMPEMVTQELEDELTGESHKLQMIRLAEMHQAKILTCDVDVKLEANHRNIKAMSINELATCFHPILIPGDKVEIKLIKKGDNQNQGIGYLPDATMVVVENAENFIGQTVTVEIKTYLQRHTGNLYFAILSE